MELASCVSKTMLARREFTEVTRCPGDRVVEELEHNASRGFGVDCNVKLIVFFFLKKHDKKPSLK